MELKKCKNCGAFINSESEFCSSCANNLSYNLTILKNYFEDENNSFDSITAVSGRTGVSPTIVQNFMIENNYIDSTEIEKTSFANIPY